MKKFRECDDPFLRGALINVEPVILMVAISLGFLSTSQPLFMYWARCVEIVNITKGYDVKNASAICAHLSNDDDFDNISNIVEKDIASTKIYLQIASSVPTLVMAPVIGTWSDKRGRKIPLLFTIIGFFIYVVTQLLATFTYEYIRFTGGVASLFGTSLTIVTDDCRNKLKPGSSTVPMRIGVAAFVQSFGTLLGTFGTSMLAVQNPHSIHEHRFSYINAALIEVSFCALALMYAIFMVRETHFPLNDVYLYNRLDSQQNSHASPSGSADIQVEQPKSLVTRLRENMCAIGEVLMQKRPGWTRCCLIMSLFFVMVEFLALGPLMLTLVHWLGKDSLMIIGGIAASAASFFLIAGAHTTEEIFLTTIFAIFCGAIGPGYRSFLPRMVPKEQTARLLTVCSMIMAFCPMMSAAVFNSIFTASMEWWPGFAFFVGGVLQVLVVVGQGGIHILMRPQWLLEKRLKAQIMTHSLTVGGELGRSDGDIAPSSTVVSDLHSGALDEQRSTSYPH
ncbi:hypothetical protein ANCCEY_07224 [Ancylostoma ceylanicum]|uniref:Transporter, major facilitator family protein n=1 Tax=Ancylostoma ceylanicum TaxID=53326 RepID=A0A0D6M187_9BILA|nr:hypothetical protein ANCCEY_07224 [Ancylostoma ceylanicum]